LDFPIQNLRRTGDLSLLHLFSGQIVLVAQLEAALQEVG
jgi:hypothetical protein